MPTSTVTDSWLIRRARSTRAAFRLVCVPNAGAGVLTFRGWAEAFPEADLALAHLPGRDGRRDEPHLASIDEAADGLVTALEGIDSLPIVVFGHSMGALIAYEVARRLEVRRREPAALVVSGRRGPTRPERHAPIGHLPIPEFGVAAQARYGGIPDDVLLDDELAEMFLPVLRSDLSMVERYRSRTAEPLSCPLVIYGGEQDPHADRADILAWTRETAAVCQVRQFSGGHFFIMSARDQVLAALRRDLATVTGIPLSTRS